MVYTIWVTEACNLRCKYCYEGSEKNQLHMTLETAEQVLRFMERDFDIENEEELVVNFHGGEPFIGYKLIKFFVEELRKRYQHRCNLFFSATTNATLFTPDIIEFIQKENIEISLSIDGAKKTHDLMRVFADGSGTHDIVIKNAKLLLKYKPSLRISMVYTPITVRYLSENIEYLLNEGFECIAASLDVYDASWNEMQLEVLKMEMIKTKQILAKFPNARVSVCEKITYCGTYCKAGINNRHIYRDGIIYPCIATGGMKEFRIGDIWSGVDKDKQKKLLKENSLNNENCKDCDLLGYCSAARCTLKNKIITGSYSEPVPIECHYTQLLYRLWGRELENV